MKRIVLIALCMIGVSTLSAQEKKPDCQPKSCQLKDKKACKPGQTKSGEAKVITTLRSEIQFIKTLNGIDGIIPPGTSDEASLAILMQEVHQLADSMDIAFSYPLGNNAQKVAALQKVAELMKSK